MAQENFKNINNHKDEGQSDIQTNEALIHETEAQAPTADTQNEAHDCCTGECGHCSQKCKVHDEESTADDEVTCNAPNENISFTDEEMLDLLAKLEKLSNRINGAGAPYLIRGFVQQIAEIVHNTPLNSLKEACHCFSLGDTTRRDLTTLVDVTIITERRKIQHYNID